MLQVSRLRPITTTDLVRLAAHATVDPRTVARAYEGGPVTSSTHARLTVAALALGLPLPPKLTP